MDGSSPDYPAFNGVHGQLVRALLAMTVGCDTCPGGVKGCGPKVASKLLLKHNDKVDTSLHNALATDIANLNNAPIKDKDATLCLCRSIIFEKTGDGEHDYVYGIAPEILEKFNEEFASSTTTVVDGPEVITCKGCNGKEHPFLKAEPSYECIGCNKIVCCFCHIHWDKIPDSEPGILCLECMNNEILGDDYLEEATMREELTKAEKIKNVRCPLRPTKALHQSQYDFTRISEPTPIQDMLELVVDEKTPFKSV
eukprot:7678910-Ditylum_brightwellii.AAC.1